MDFLGMGVNDAKEAIARRLPPEGVAVPYSVWPNRYIHIK